MADASEVVRRVWELFQARRWDEALELFAPDFVAEWPHSRERFRGRDAFVAMQRAYPEGWSIEVVGVVAEGDRAASLVRVTQEGEVFHAATFFDVRDGRLARAVELWVTEGAEAPPAWRARFSEPL
jgi:ketosteroid isomerase-like protein